MLGLGYLNPHKSASFRFEGSRHQDSLGQYLAILCGHVRAFEVSKQAVYGAGFKITKAAKMSD